MVLNKLGLETRSCVCVYCAYGLFLVLAYRRKECKMAGFWGVSRAIEPLDTNGLIIQLYL